jgi:hypothetical protein
LTPGAEAVGCPRHRRAALRPHAKAGRPPTGRQAADVGGDLGDQEVRRLLEEDCPHAKKVRLVCDNLSTHYIASLYEAFDAETAHRLEIHDTPGKAAG